MGVKVVRLAIIDSWVILSNGTNPDCYLKLVFRIPKEARRRALDLILCQQEGVHSDY